MNPKSRREFLRNTALLSAGGLVSPFIFSLASVRSAIAQTAGPVKAIIYVNMNGGNDSHNTVLATDPDSFSTYLKYRDTSAVDGADSIALPNNSLLPINPLNAAGLNTGRTFALHPNLLNLQSLFATKKAAIVANVGPMLVPVSAAQYAAQSVPLPLNLFAHNSQSATWQSSSASGAQYGWGGLVADSLMTQNSGAIFTSISASGNAVFLAGDRAVRLEVGSSGLPAINELEKSALFDPFGGEAPDSTLSTFKSIQSATRSDLFAQDVVNITQRSVAAQALFKQSLVPAYNATSAPNGVAAPPANNDLAAKFQTILRILASSASLGTTRQIFYTSFGGFDSHDGEIVNHGALMTTFDEAVGYFMTTAAGLGLANSATLFTGSEFGRTFSSNGDGSDHGWGAHHFVIGGAVRGGEIYGRFPTLGVGNADNVGTALLPSLAVDQYAATLASWMGVSTSTLPSIFPHLSNFNEPNLGFMSA